MINRNIDPIVALIALVCLAVAALLCGCGGGGNATVEEIAQHDADVQTMALKTMTIQTPDCSKGACK